MTGHVGKFIFSNVLHTMCFLSVPFPFAVHADGEKPAPRAADGIAEFSMCSKTH